MEEAALFYEQKRQLLPISVEKDMTRGTAYIENIPTQWRLYISINTEVQRC